MVRKFLLKKPINSAAFAAYLQDLNLEEIPILKEIREDNQNLNRGFMMADYFTIQFLCWLAASLGVKHYLELGVYTGYSSTAMALSLSKEARLHLCDLNVSTTNRARYYWHKAGIKEKIHLYLAPAYLTLNTWRQEKINAYFDFAFINADKTLIQDYADLIYPFLKPGAIMAFDNAYAQGKVGTAGLGAQEQDFFNRKILRDQRFSSLLLPVGDGLILLKKR